jgi:hypothetical protein
MTSCPSARPDSRQGGRRRTNPGPPAQHHTNITSNPGPVISERIHRDMRSLQGSHARCLHLSASCPTSQVPHRYLTGTSQVPHSTSQVPHRHLPGTAECFTGVVPSLLQSIVLLHSTVVLHTPTAMICTASQQSAGQKGAEESTAQHSTAQHSTAQHSTAQHSTAQDPGGFSV